MADEQSQMNNARSQDAWLVATVALGAIVAVSLVAVFLVIFLSKAPSQVPASINNSTTNNFDLPSKTDKTGLQRTVAGDGAANSASLRRAPLNRSDPDSPPFTKLDANAPRVYLRMHAAPVGGASTRGPLPMPVRYVADSSGQVGDVYASVPGSGVDNPAFSYLPDKNYSDTVVRGAALELSFSQARKTSTWGPYRAPKDFQFFAAKVKTRNTGRVALAFHPDDFEIRDNEGLRYLPANEILDRFFGKELAPGATSEFDLAFLVPAEAPVATLLAKVLGGGVVQARLDAR